tara:strand:+ start:569 stop:1234 length:666 start_codon:yes stop_codon:yes gene_type:complete
MVTVVGELVAVLEADTADLEQGFDKAGAATDRYAQEQQAASLATMETLARQEALLGSMNQVIGGYGKMVGAAQKLNLVTEEQFQQLEKSRAALEMAAGPIEIYIALKKAKVAMEAKDNTMTGASTKATVKHTGAMARLNAVYMANPLIFIAVLVVALVASLYLLEKRFGTITWMVDGLAKMFRKFKEDIDSVSGSVTGLGDKMGIIGDIGDKMTGYIGSIT